MKGGVGIHPKTLLRVISHLLSIVFILRCAWWQFSHCATNLQLPSLWTTNIWHSLIGCQSCDHAGGFLDVPLSKNKKQKTTALQPMTRFRTSRSTSSLWRSSFITSFVFHFLTFLLIRAVCRGLIKNGERQDEESVGGRRRTEALRQLCQMNPSQALNIRAMAVSGHVHVPTPAHALK